jgi:NADH:ubiquinone oxidoreductase subunit F (NADH-binding)
MSLEPRNPRRSTLLRQLEAGSHGATSFAESAARLDVPPAALRGVESFYAELVADRGAIRVCHGTSCMLRGADALHASLARTQGCRTVYCIGYCDRSPAILRPDDRVELGAGNDPTARPDIRCRARAAIVTARIARGDHADISVARAAGVYESLSKALAGPAEEILAHVERSGERGRGGAGFPTGVKWRTCAATTGERRWVIANGDEGDPGSFIDRVLMEHDPHALLEGMILCARAIGAHVGIVYIRAEYPRAQAVMRRAIDQARAAGLLGADVLGTGFEFDVEVFPGMGSYVCGEETAMLEAIEGRRGEVRLRPPFPAENGLYCQPTVVNNVETLVNVPWIVAHGADAYRSLGTPGSAGTKAICLNAGFARPGIVEVELGTPLREIIEQEARGGRDGARLAAVVLAGPMGSVLGPEEWDVPIGYAEMSARGIQLGHGGLVAIPEDVDFAALVRHHLRFAAHESCGRCAPCRLGSKRALEIAEAGLSREDEPELARVLEIMHDASLCAFGQLTPQPIRRMLERFGDRIFTGGGAR